MKKIVFLLSISLVVMISCSKNSESPSGGGGGGTTTCTGTKSWTSDVSPIVSSTCAINSGCHGSGSTNGPGALLTYTQVYNARTSIRSAVASGSMPQGGSLSTTQKNNILCWIDNGAPNN